MKFDLDSGTRPGGEGYLTMWVNGQVVGTKTIEKSNREYFSL